MIDQYQHTIRTIATALPEGHGGIMTFPELLTEEELVLFLRIADVSNSRNHHNVIEHLKRYRDLPRIHICNKALYPMQAIRKWIDKETTDNN